ncbi:MAG: Ig-like domain-containing protein, partial [Gammaproteobacteria bacterium]
SALTGTLGRLTLAADGSYSYVADQNGANVLAAGATATDVFTYTVSDGTTTDTGQITVTVTGVNDAPTGTNRTIAIAQDGSHTFQASDFGFSDVDGGSLARITVVNGPGAGTLKLGNLNVSNGQTIAADAIGELVFTPAAGANGNNYASFTFKVNDGTADSASANTITINVTPVKAPTAVDKILTINEDSSHAFQASDFGFSDVDGGSLAHITVVNGPGKGTLKLGKSNVNNGQTIAADAIGGLVFTPAAGANGNNYASFVFKVNDGTVDSVSANTITVNVTSVNDAPTNIFMLPDATLLEGQGFLLRAKKAFTDVDRGKFGKLSYSAKNLPADLRINATTGKIKGKARIPGRHNIVVIATDGGGLSTQATFTLTVVPNRPPDPEVNLPRVKPPITEPVPSVDATPIGLKDVVSDVPNDFNFYGGDIISPGLPMYIGRPEATVGVGRVSDRTGGDTQADVSRGPMAKDSGGLSILDVKMGGDIVDIRIRDDKVGGAEEYTGELADGSPLPEWITVDRQTGFATAKLPEGVREVELRILARDQDGNIRKLDVVLDTQKLKSGADEAPIDEQLQAAVERSENASRRARTDVDINVTSDGEVVVAKKDIQVGGSDAVTTRPRTVVRVGSDGKVNFDRGSADGDSGGLNILDVEIGGDIIVVHVGDDRSGGAVEYTGVLENGSPLPEWIKVDPQTGALTAEPPEGIEEIELRLIARDADGTIRTLDVLLDVRELKKGEENAPAEGEPQAAVERFVPLSEQIAREAERREGYGERIARALVQAA